MLLERFYDDGLAQASYLLGCSATGEALVVDSNRDIEQYLKGTERHGLRVTHVAETHIHADFVSGSRELAERTGATLYLSGEGGREWRYAFTTRGGVVPVRHGDAFTVGRVRIEVIHTPGHTPEHVCFLVTDTAGANEPMGIFTGDFVFVGDVGRPDLLERAANVTGTMRESARQLYASLERFRRQPDYLQIWPGHGAGSACGRSLGAMPQSTAGYEKLFNWAFGDMSEAEFVEAVLSGQPEPPRYFAQMKRVNREGPAILGRRSSPPRLPAEQLHQAIDAGATVVDTRNATEFAAGHVAGTINIPLDRSFVTWAGWLLPYTQDVYLISSEPGIQRAWRDLTLIGLDRQTGYFGPEVLQDGAARGTRLATIPQVRAAELAREIASGTATVVDVRGHAEWTADHIPNSRNVPLGYLDEHIPEFRAAPKVVLQCGTGARSSIAASVLQAHGVAAVANLAGGLEAWRASGYPVERGER